ncbi:hypothetical protein P153DRAFT_430690 [Dothidotthia symphoricarpi CBS 119687]|uniref:Uncharacterized protein n=1 Tax=Dothidotthia symphoricarpi CBS 119687 TaxID=1392245 RepID=A0A6A6AHZ5_9PLEO|nr:uncharacterized protein P153DRAFT_430690 [Dothidotthia symphoricarpi CBS 119687]KAF2130494.1 hypothetical protein P153DRAFT_430690 [Dothidotthia symphoricarpi CBS 119687]
MAQASLERSIVEPAESSTAAILLRNDDPLTRALRGRDAVDVEDLVRLARATSPTSDILPSLGSSSTAVFSSLGESTVTKPTSTGTSYPIYDPEGKGKAKAPSISSLSATHGSGSEAEASDRAVREHALLAMGDWIANEDVAPVLPLKGTARAKQRTSNSLRHKHKKPVIDQVGLGRLSGNDSDGAGETRVPQPHDRENICLQHHVHNQDHNQLRLAEEGHQSDTATTASLPCEPLTGTRLYVLIVIIVTITLAIASSALGAYYTGKDRMVYTKAIIFAATVFTTLLTVLALIVARRALHEALLAGLLGFIIGSMFLVELDDFMGPPVDSGH